MKDHNRWAKGVAPLALALAFVFAGCGGGKGSGAEATPEQKIAQLEASGALPRLERLPSVEGMDANRNGVRDDIETHIHRKYTDPAQRRAAMQMARAYQRMLLVDKMDAIGLDQVSALSFRAIVCLDTSFVGAGAPNSAIVLEELRDLTTNTKERLKAYLAYNKARSGSVSRLPEGNTCE